MISTRDKIKGRAFLLIATIIWGTAFIFQKMGMDHVGPFTFGIFRFCLGALALLPVIWIADGIARKKQRAKTIVPFNDKTLLVGGLLCGAANFVAGSLQQVGLVYTTAGKAGFITSLDIVIVPLLMLTMKRKVGRNTWIGIAMACVGLWLLCIKEGFSIQLGDGLVIGCAFGYSFQILLIDYYSEKTDPIKLSFVTFMIAGIMSGIVAIFAETIRLQDILDCAIPILYVALLEVCVAFTLQIVGQKYTPPALAAIIMSMESVFAALCGGVFLHEVMTGREIAGCVIMFTAFILSQLPDRQKAKAGSQT
ncbi:MAG: DMT family transporter [Bacillota bacterium]|nr:DMT family transporter [Bacillota bacterium]